MSIIIKTPEQIQGIRKSCRLTAESLQYLKKLVRPGVTTEFLDAKAEEFIRDHGAIPACLNYCGFPKTLCTSINSVVCHGIPDKTELKEGDILSIDTGTILDGYFGDTCITVPVGEISKEAKDLIKVTRKCLEAGIKEVFPGNNFGNIGYKIQKLASNYGYGIVYQFTGHGVGLEFHEDPEVLHTAKKNSGPAMKPGMIFTIEPMINIGLGKVKVDSKDKWTVRTIDGSLSAQFEHTILVTKKGKEVFTEL